MRHFTSYGPVNPSRNFFVPRSALVQQCVETLVGDSDSSGHYFTIWAPRQTGKTWLMRRIIEEIQARYGERFLVGAVSMQDVVLSPDEAPEALLAWLPKLFFSSALPKIPALSSWSDFRDLFIRGASPLSRPIILLIDEFDKLPAAAIDLLVGQFRGLYLNREQTLLHGLALIGVRAVLGVDSERGSPFNVQRSLRVPNLTSDEVHDLFQQYQRESGQPVATQVVDALYEVTRGQPGLVGWLGELLTEKYNPSVPAPIEVPQWEQVYTRACRIEPNNTVLNLLKKARDARCRCQVVALFKNSNIPFSFDEEWCSYLYLNGVIDYCEQPGPSGTLEPVCRFSSPFVQRRLFAGFAHDMAVLSAQVPVVDPRVDLTEVFARLDLPGLLGAYRDFLQRLKASGHNPWRGQPRRAHLHLTEAVGHFHLYWWLVEATGRRFVISPEFPTGNGKVDLLIQRGSQAGVIEVKSFTQRSDLPEQREQAARYARGRGLDAATLALFVPSDDEDLVAGLCGTETVAVTGQPVLVTTVAIAAA